MFIQFKAPGFHTLEVLAFLGIAGGLIVAAIPNYRYLKAVTVSSSIHNGLSGVDKSVEFCLAESRTAVACADNISIFGQANVNAVMQPYATFVVSNPTYSIAAVTAILDTNNAKACIATTGTPASIIDSNDIGTLNYGAPWSRGYINVDTKCKVH
ncbi:MAG: hypothetical protein V4534_09220 [Myxococcota bacterium]